MNPFGLIIIVDSNGNAEGDLFYDDGETIDTIEKNLYFYAKYKWSSNKCQLNIEILQNNYIQMSNLILDSLSIYGLNQVPLNINVNNKQVSSIMRSQTQIIDITGLELSMSSNYTIIWMCQNRTESANDQDTTTEGLTSLSNSNVK
jgi:hypothetical protein